MKVFLIVSILFYFSSSYASNLQCNSIFNSAVSKDFESFEENLFSNLESIVTDFNENKKSLYEAKSNIEYNHHLADLVDILNNLSYQLIEVSLFEKTMVVSDLEKTTLNINKKMIKDLFLQMGIQGGSFLLKYTNNAADEMLNIPQKKNFSFGFIKQDSVEVIKEDSKRTFGFLRTEVEEHLYGNEKIKSEEELQAAVNKLPTIGFIQNITPASENHNSLKGSIGFVLEKRFVDVPYKNSIVFDNNLLLFRVQLNKSKIGF